MLLGGVKAKKVQILGGIDTYTVKGLSCTRGRRVSAGFEPRFGNIGPQRRIWVKTNILGVQAPAEKGGTQMWARIRGASDRGNK